VSDPELVASALVSALGLPGGSTRPPQIRLIEHLRRKEMLLVLDNFEQLISASSPAVALAATLLAECPGLSLLVTSRERLHLRAEQRYRVQPLALEAAVELFVQRCTAVDAGFVLAEGNRPLIEAICEQVDRLPLAIELCAAQTDLLSLPQLLAGLQIAGSSCWWAARRICRPSSAPCAPPSGTVTTCWTKGSAPSSAAWGYSWVGVIWRRSKPSAHGARQRPDARGSRPCTR
jgi:predicted ATPase